MSDTFSKSLVVWELTLTEEDTGNILYSNIGKNIVVVGGRALEGYNLFGLGASAVLVSICAGACATTATVNDTRLNYEHILNPQRKTLTNTSLALLTTPDVVVASITDTFGEPYYRSLTSQCVYNGSTDGNVNQPFQEFGLNTSTVLPATPTSTSGVLYDHYVNTSPIILTSGTILTVQVTIYW